MRLEMGLRHDGSWISARFTPCARVLVGVKPLHRWRIEIYHGRRLEASPKVCFTARARTSSMITAEHSV